MKHLLIGLLIWGVASIALAAPQPTGLTLTNLQTDDYVVWIGAVTEAGMNVPATLVIINIDDTADVELGPHPSQYRDPDIAAPAEFDGLTINADVENDIPLSTTKANMIGCSALYLIIKGASGGHPLNVEIQVEY